MHSDGQREKSFRQNPQGNSKIRRKSADFSYSHKKIDIRNAFADETRLTRSSGYVVMRHF